MSRPPPRQSAVRTALAGLIGNVLEWFDFAVFGIFAVTIGNQFFPSEDPTAATLKAYGVFLLGFIARPAGSIVLGMVGDRIGRRALLTLSILIMGVATLGIGLLPSYKSIGVAAPILLIVFRMLQGFSLGGEFTGSMVYTTELASPLMRGLVSSSTAAGTTIGFFLGSLSALLVSTSLGDADAQAWGWRIPFIASVGFVILGWFLRKGIHESEQGEKATALRPPVFASLIADWKPILQTFGILGLTNAVYYITFTYAVAQREGENPNFQLANMMALLVVLVAKPVGGWLSDRVGRKRLMLVVQVAGMLLIYPAFNLMLFAAPVGFWMGQAMLAIPLGLGLGLQGAMLVEIFPLRTRVMSMSIAYSVALALSGGAAPLVSKWLSNTYVNPFLPGYFVLIYGVIGLAIMLGMRETNGRSLDD